MTDTEALALGKRAVACKAWHRTPGMRAIDGSRVVQVGESVRRGDGAPLSGCLVWTLPADCSSLLPDLRDHATIGGLLALVREAWDDARISTYAVKMKGQHWWNVGVPWEADSGGRFCATAPSEAEALVLALEAAASRRP